MDVRLQVIIRLFTEKIHEGTNNCAYGVNSHTGGNGC
nr:MAG TPA: hypothetical protein [Bacteriophage sp.]